MVRCAFFVRISTLTLSNLETRDEKSATKLIRNKISEIQYSIKSSVCLFIWESLSHRLRMIIIVVVLSSFPLELFFLHFSFHPKKNYMMMSSSSGSSETTRSTRINSKWIFIVFEHLERIENFIINAIKSKNLANVMFKSHRVRQHHSTKLSASLALAYSISL